MIRPVELSLFFSKKIHDQLLLLLLTDPFNGAILKMGIVERIILDFAHTPYDTVVSGEPYPKYNSTYSYTFVIHDDYLHFMCFDYGGAGTITDKYKARINWITDNDITIGAYKNSIVHAKHSKGFNTSSICGIPNLYGYFKTNRIDKTLSLEDVNNNVIRYILPDEYYPQSYFNAVITDTGMQLALFTFKDNGDGILLDNQKINSDGLKDNEQFTYAGQQIFKGLIPFESTDYLNIIYPANEWAIKQNTSGYIATVKNMGFRRSLVLPVNEESCYVLWNGRNPTSWDRQLFFINQSDKTELTKPDLPSLYPELGINYFGSAAHQSYEIYYDTTNGFWKEFVYSEELIDE
ncbi:hypothetical protein MTZ49_07240 [Entomomonas sp. E2T0]|uniref:hypothetical protein n=1 Tax=Entomomonas sp. E2T0 TaxID=2930213 RepID=UPI0022282608|nr:hypothetical protein [Entomomonas sp. E2T0]UYZ85333.1 hypothetical protein MTZ49_07240 [Entomomonas sp. E2T0]